jgi:hypothetical protein
VVKLNKKTFTSDVVFISGLTRSGKTLLCPIISSFCNSEKINLEPNFENLLELKQIECIREDTLVYLLRSFMNLMIYNDAIGRNVNFRQDDYTSVWNYVDPSAYMSRLNKTDGDSVCLEINNSNRLFPIMLHDGLWHAEYIFKAFPKSKIIHMQRHPVDLVYSWSRKGYGGSFFESLRSNIVTYLFNNKVVPYYAFKWEEEYLSLDEVDRVIHMINKLLNHHIIAYNKLSKGEQKQVFCVNHQRLATYTHEVIEEIEVFLESEMTEHTSDVLKRENCPREFFPTERRDKLKYIKSKCSITSFNLLNSMIDAYDNQLSI